MAMQEDGDSVIEGDDADALIDEIERVAGSSKPKAMSSFAALPQVKAIINRCREKGYGDDDPLLGFVQLAEVLDNRAVEIHAIMASESEALSDALVATMTQLQLFGDKAEIVLDAYERHQDQVAKRDQLAQELAEVMSDMVSAVQAHTGEFSEAAKVIENRSLVSVALGWLSPVLALVAGLVLGALFL